MKSDAVVIIPTYNEKENIENIIRAVLGLDINVNILIIDDGSPDGTADIVKRLQKDEFADRLRRAIGANESIVDKGIKLANTRFT